MIDCSVQNQGCDGGYPYLVEKFGAEYHIIEEKYRPYIAKTEVGQCNNPLMGDLQRFFKVTQRKYVGGSYGRSNEYEMMKELKENGPIVVSFEPDEGF